MKATTVVPGVTLSLAEDVAESTATRVWDLLAREFSGYQGAAVAIRLSLASAGWFIEAESERRPDQIQFSEPALLTAYLQARVRRALIAGGESCVPSHELPQDWAARPV